MSLYNACHASSAVPCWYQALCQSAELLRSLSCLKRTKSGTCSTLTTEPKSKVLPKHTRCCSWVWAVTRRCPFKLNQRVAFCCRSIRALLAACHLSHVADLRTHIDRPVSPSDCPPRSLNHHQKATEETHSTKINICLVNSLTAIKDMIKALMGTIYAAVGTAR